MIKQVNFDFFGVLTEDGWLRFSRQFDGSPIYEELRYINYQYDHGALSYEDFVSRAAKLTGKDRSWIDDLIGRQHYPNQGLFSYARDLKTSGLKLGIISNVGSPLSRFLPGQDYAIFENVTLSYEVGAAKPEPLIFQWHLDKSKLSPEEVIFVDDRSINCEGAAMIGMNVVLYENLEQTIKEIEAILSL